MRRLLQDLLDPLPQGRLELSHALMVGELTDLDTEVLGRDLRIVDLLRGDVLHGAEEGEHDEEEDGDKQVREDNDHGHDLLLQRGGTED